MDKKNIEQTIKILEAHIEKLSNISIEEQKENLLLMLVVTDSIKTTALTLSIFYKI